ncbi:MAG: hypothetical protein HGA44_19705, partial [Cellulomonadaceae bacterium]|nr:hypothetical protein [Cellulomonadaceae bacterium]
RADLDPAQLATDLYGVMLAYYHAARLLDDPAAERRARAAVEALISAARAGAPRPGDRAATDAEPSTHHQTGTTLQGARQ